MTANWKIWSELPRAFTPRAGDKKPFLGPTLNFDRTYLCNGTWYRQSEQTCQSIGTPLHVLQKRLRTVGDFLPTQSRISETKLTMACFITSLHGNGQCELIWPRHKLNTHTHSWFLLDNSELPLIGPCYKCIKATL